MVGKSYHMTGVVRYTAKKVFGVSSWWWKAQIQEKIQRKSLA